MTTSTNTLPSLVEGTMGVGATPPGLPSNTGTLGNLSRKWNVSFPGIGETGSPYVPRPNPVPAFGMPAPRLVQDSGDLDVFNQIIIAARGDNRHTDHKLGAPVFIVNGVASSQRVVGSIPAFETQNPMMVNESFQISARDRKIKIQKMADEISNAGEIPVQLYNASARRTEAIFQETPFMANNADEFLGKYNFYGFLANSNAGQGGLRLNQQPSVSRTLEVLHSVLTSGLAREVPNIFGARRGDRCGFVVYGSNGGVTPEKLFDLLGGQEPTLADLLPRLPVMRIIPVALSTNRFVPSVSAALPQILPQRHGGVPLRTPADRAPSFDFSRLCHNYDLGASPLTPQVEAPTMAWYDWDFHADTNGFGKNVLSITPVHRQGAFISVGTAEVVVGGTPSWTEKMEVMNDPTGQAFEAMRRKYRVHIFMGAS